MPATKTKPTRLDLASKLWTIGAKVSGMGYLLKHQRNELHAAEETQIGIGQILMDLALDIDVIRAQIDEHDN